MLVTGFVIVAAGGWFFAERFPCRFLGGALGANGLSVGDYIGVFTLVNFAKDTHLIGLFRAPLVRSGGGLTFLAQN